MLWMLDKNRQESGNGGMDMMGMMMMSSMMGGQNPLGNMFGGQTTSPSPYTPVGNPTPQTPTTPTVDEALDIILKNPDAIAKLKDALKAE
jgi:hypothetical protein